MARDEIKIVITADDEASGPLGAVAQALATTGGGFSRLQQGVTAASTAFLAARAAVQQAREIFEVLYNVLVRDTIQFAAFAEQLTLTAERLGTTATHLRVMQFEAGMVGVSAEELAQSLTFLNRNIAAAAAGSEQTAGAFAALGLRAEALRSIPVDRQLALVARGFANVSDA